jgi:hypothetical protein
VATLSSPSKENARVSSSLNEIQRVLRDFFNGITEADSGAGRDTGFHCSLEKSK